MTLNTLDGPYRKVIIVPIDDRPVTYLFPQLVARVAGIHAVAPPREFMGSLTGIADFAAINRWLNNEICTGYSDALPGALPNVLFLCLDTILYGGLVASRRGNETLRDVLERASILARLKEHNPQVSMYAQSAIMRIPDYDDNTEEPAYWSKYGRKLFAWSVLLHKQALGESCDESELRQIASEIPAEVQSDFRARRDRNFKAQQQLLKYVEEQIIDFLIFSLDDSGRYGLNVLECDSLVAQCEQLNLNNVIAYAGADEVMLTLISRWLIGTSGRSPIANVHLSPGWGGNISSNYEGQTISSSLKKQAFAAGLTLLDKPLPGADLELIIHTSGEKQGDHIWLPGHPDMRVLNTSVAVQQTIQLIEYSSAPCILCDVAYSNGADPALVEGLLARPELLNKLYAYAGWNTTGNTIGSAIALGVARWLAMCTGSKDTAGIYWQQAMFVRLADDYAYQTQVRRQLSTNLSPAHVDSLMQPYAVKIAQALSFESGQVEFSLPWNRTFEVEVACRSGIR